MSHTNDTLNMEALVHAYQNGEFTPLILDMMAAQAAAQYLGERGRELQERNDPDDAQLAQTLLSISDQLQSTVDRGAAHRMFEAQWDDDNDDAQSERMYQQNHLP